ncbi:MAG TPA: acetyl-CoA carboxylase carboxyltransferase subunit beta [candidate division WOR-3 bacterium]|uniref:Acetyl-coenzyme A carboxylase carboxyl transferase subunit beta n=1 Tax=candidate division WOR-3 bacterium TaxID=2052148 RepID=A0A7V5HPL2_UNCW3|nr:acetyl-CoA carboxylase carboxyltransferase subunit beta [candidate division WOR-3 bacterium]
MLFKKRKKIEGEKKDIPEGLFLKCEKCGELFYKNQLEKNLWVCPKCSFHFRVGVDFYKKILFDDGDFIEQFATDLESQDPLNFPGYKEKLERAKAKTGLKEAAISGLARINGKEVVFFLTDFRFLGGSMGSVYGEIFYRAAQEAIKRNIPFISLTSSGGGARMHEGIFSLMQMVKTTVAVVEMEEKGIPFISVLADPTMGGVMASFASLGDIIIAEPGALLGFAGPRVIQQTIKQDLPPGFQRSEFLLEKGFVDMVVPRKELKSVLSKLLNILGGENGRS